MSIMIKGAVCPICHRTTLPADSQGNAIGICSHCKERGRTACDSLGSHLSSMFRSFAGVVSVMAICALVLAVVVFSVVFFQHSIQIQQKNRLPEWTVIEAQGHQFGYTDESGYVWDTAFPFETAEQAREAMGAAKGRWEEITRSIAWRNDPKNWRPVKP